MTSISFQSKALVVCLVTTDVFVDFCLKKLNVFPNMLVKTQMNICIPQDKTPGNWNVNKNSLLITSWDIT